jgi:hypothetical protein
MTTRGPRDSYLKGRLEWELLRVLEDDKERTIDRIWGELTATPGLGWLAMDRDAVNDALISFQNRHLPWVKGLEHPANAEGRPYALSPTFLITDAGHAACNRGRPWVLVEGVAPEEYWEDADPPLEACP